MTIWVGNQFWFWGFFFNIKSCPKAETLTYFSQIPYQKMLKFEPNQNHITFCKIRFSSENFETFLRATP